MSRIFNCEYIKILIKYKNFYNFNGFLKLQSVKFKPFPDNISLKTKNSLILLKSNKKYTFYSIIHSYNNYCRIFCYTLFGKRVADILFFNNQIYLVPSKNKEIYLIDLKKNISSKSIFIFLKDVVKGIQLDNAYGDDSCYYGFYNDFSGKCCKRDGFSSVELKKGDIFRSVKIIGEKNRLPYKIILNFGDKILKIKILEILKPEKNPEKIFFETVKKYKRYYIKDLIKFEKAIFMESENENK